MIELKKLVDTYIKEIFYEEVDSELTRPDPQYGDFACNIALQLGKKLKKNPRDIAQAVVDQLAQTDIVASAEVAGPGFINIWVSDTYLMGYAEAAKLYQPYKNKKVVIETNNPNPFKAMHIGHAFNAIVAETIANLLEAGGAEIHRVSYHGDVGSHVGKSMYSLLRYVNGDLSKLKSIPAQERNSFMSKMYAEGAKAYKDSESAKAEIDKLAEQSFVLEDFLYKEVYETVKRWSFDQIDELVARLGNKPIEKRYLESEADILGVKTVKAHSGDVFIESEGAMVFPGSKYGSFDNVFVSSNGRGLYGARDLGLMQLKNNDYHADKSYIVTAEEQRDYFKGVIKAAELCLPELKDVTINIPTGTVKLTSGKMSSRSGEVIEVDWLFEQIASAIKERGSEANEAIMTSAMRYQFLKVRIGSDVIFDVNEASSIQGNSGPYLQYAYARACSVLAKSSDSNVTFENLTKEEHQLLLKTSEFNEVFERSVTELMPHHICAYLYQLTQEFNRFYEKNRVIGDGREAIRLALIKLYIANLRRGLLLLGIPAIESM